MAKQVGQWFHYSGAVHMHTTESDGTKTLEEVIQIGREVGLDFMMFSDHMTLAHRERGGEGIYGDTLAVIGYEHNDATDCHHYLLFESPVVYPRDFTPKQYVAAGAADNAIGIMAHPDEIRDRMPNYPPYPWLDWDVKGFTGLELWNQMSEWMEKLTPYNKLLMSLSPRKSMIGPTDRILRKWDELNMTGRCVGIAGADAHAFPVYLGPLKIEIFPYKVHFRALRTNIILSQPLSKDLIPAKQQLYSALRDCRVYNANIRWGEADDFLFTVSNGQAAAVSGDDIKLIPDHTNLAVSLPDTATIKVVHDGRYVHQSAGKKLELAVALPGMYRVEAWKGKRGWIFSNHIRVSQ